MHRIGIHFNHENYDNREAFRGICEYVRQNELDWRLTVVGRLTDDPNAYETFAGGIIATHDEATRRFFHKNGLPASTLSSRFYDELLPQIWHDETAIGSMAADHLIQRGYRRFGWFGDENSETSTRRRQGFIDALNERGLGLGHMAVDAPTWNVDDAGLLTAALKDDREPIGCFASDDPRGVRVVNACRDAGIDVPRRVGVLGADNTPYHCESSFPPLSSIELDMKGRGIEAARLVAEQLNGTNAKPEDIFVRPLRIVARESTGFATTGDALVDKAIAFIHARARRDVRVGDVVRYVKTNRRTLSWKFRKVLDTTPHHWILNARIEAIKELLVTTDLDTEALTEAAGFVSRSHMSRVFREATGMTLIQFRKQARNRG